MHVYINQYIPGVTQNWTLGALGQTDYTTHRGLLNVNNKKDSLLTFILVVVLTSTRDCRTACTFSSEAKMDI